MTTEYSQTETPALLLRLNEEVQLDRPNSGRRAYRKQLGLSAQGGAPVILSSFGVIVTTDFRFRLLSEEHALRMDAGQMLMTLLPQVMASYPFVAGQLHEALFADNVRRCVPRFSRYRWARLWSQIVSPGSEVHVPQDWNRQDQVGVRVIAPVPAELPTSVLLQDIAAVPRVDLTDAARLLRMLNEQSDHNAAPLMLQAVAEAIASVRGTSLSAAAALPAIPEVVVPSAEPAKRILRIPSP